MLNEDDPVTFWKKEGRHQKKLVSWLKGRDKVVLRGANVDLKMSIKDRSFIPCNGKVNFPDGEIFTGPVEESVSGWIRFRYPAIEYGQEITDIELWFEKGKVVKEKASKNLELLSAVLNSDGGARYLGEFGIGTNYGIQKFTKNMLFDEKIGGTIHLAVGAGYPESGSKNESGVHWDMLFDMNDAEIKVIGRRDRFAFQRVGSFGRAGGRRVPRYRCVSCGKTFSKQAFSVSYFSKRPELIAPVAAGLVNGAAHRQIARSVDCAPSTVTRLAAKLGRHALLLQLLLVLHLRHHDEETVLDHAEAFEGSQDDPFAVATLVGRDSWFIYGL